MAARNNDLDPLESAPLAQQAREAILEAILSKRFVDRLPPEDELARMLDVSRTTVRAALQSLEQGGVVTRRRAVGTLIHKNVSASRLALQRLIGFDRLLSELGGDVRIDVAWDRGPAPPDFVTVFGLDTHEEYIRTRKSYFTNDEIAIFIRDALPVSELAIEPDDDIPPSLFEFSRRYYRNAIDHAAAEIVPMTMDQVGNTQLKLEEGEPYIRLHQRAYSRSEGGQPVAYSMTDVEDRFVRYEVFRR